MKKSLIIHFFLVFCFFAAFAQISTPNDGDWSKQFVTLKNTPEADFMIRVGDIDNLGFNFEEGSNPFCGRSTYAHGFPWDAVNEDATGTDRILIPSSYIPDAAPCGGDGYSGEYEKPSCKPTPITIPLESIKGAKINNAYLQLFIDDFQVPVLCSRFQMTLNGKRLVEGEKLINSVNQTGPVGKLITIAIPEDFYGDLQGNALTLFIDDKTTHAGDGFALDFAKLMINRKSTGICKGSVKGFVVDEDGEAPISGALVQTSGKLSVTTGADGSFEFKNIPAGLELLTAVAKGYAEGTGVADVAEGEENEVVYIRLRRGNKTAEYDGKTLTEGESVVMNNILFDQGSATLRAESKGELDKIIRFMQSNPGAEIELSGHTSSEGEATLNRSLSYKRVKSCKDYIISKGIDTGRILAVGYGPDRPVASNASEDGRAQNRRVEMRILKL